MTEQQNLWQFMMQQSDKLLSQTVTHIGLTCISLSDCRCSWFTAWNLDF